MMNKIFGMICLILIGLIYGGVILIVYSVGLIYLLLNEIIGTKKFMKKFRELNKIAFTEFKDIFKAFKNIFEIA